MMGNGALESAGTRWLYTPPRNVSGVMLGYVRRA
jgi:hypothetical protein